MAKLHVEIEKRLMNIPLLLPFAEVKLIVEGIKANKIKSYSSLTKT